LKRKLLLLLVTALAAFNIYGCAAGHKAEIVKVLGEEEYTRLMGLTLDDFDQSYDGFRQYSDDYELVSMLIPEYISENRLTAIQSRNLHWHLGQIHAFNQNYQDAVREMKQSYEGGSTTWRCYVDGSIAFLERDRVALQRALNTLSEQENQMNLEVLEKLLKYFDRSYLEAYSQPY